MENLIYWQGKAVGREFGDYVTFFPSAPPEAVAALSQRAKHTEADSEKVLASVVTALNVQLDTLPGLADAVEALIKQRASQAEIQSGMI
ncbi:hypothetical protein NCCP691_25410 [Noviherbaspirillum aridicola]|uniref:Uncharacterized protein n=2 Tax=Noviherbaspirillum aridicola TaxID=2849687 RepID=A0ABQ4Q5Q3_9BURK|nr:hypothetical protein NCCP691_25410 [Noviherbaspirillum aridicola]